MYRAHHTNPCLSVLIGWYLWSSVARLLTVQRSPAQERSERQAEGADATSLLADTMSRAGGEARNGLVPMAHAAPATLTT